MPPPLKGRSEDKGLDRHLSKQCSVALTGSLLYSSSQQLKYTASQWQRCADTFWKQPFIRILVLVRQNTFCCVPELVAFIGVNSPRKFRCIRNFIHGFTTAVSLSKMQYTFQMIRGHQKSCEYQGLRFEITAEQYSSGMQAFRNIDTLSDEGPRAALRCSLFSRPSILPRLFSMSSELWTQQSIVLKFSLAESAL